MGRAGLVSYYPRDGVLVELMAGERRLLTHQQWCHFPEKEWRCRQAWARSQAYGARCRHCPRPWTKRCDAESLVRSRVGAERSRVLAYLVGVVLDGLHLTWVYRSV